MILLNAITILGYLATLVFIFKKHQRYFTFFAFLSFMQLWALVSCFYNDLGVYNIELFQYTEQTLATTRLGVLYIVFNLGFIFTANIIGEKVLTQRDYALKNMSFQLGNFKLITYLVVLFVGMYLLYRLFTEGIPLLSGLDRLRYVQKAGALEQFLVIYGQLIAFALGLFGKHKRALSFNSIVFSCFIFYAILTGHKFSFLFILLVSYFTPIFIRYVHRHVDFKLFRLRYFMLTTVFCSIFLLMAYSAYRRVFENYEGAQALLFDRVFAMEGEMWWVTDYNRSTFNAMDSRHWEAELNYILSPETNPVEEVGMRYLMIKAIGPQKAYPLFDGGYLYTMTYPAILIATVPYIIAGVIQFAAGVLFFLLLFYLYYSIIYRHYFRAIVTFLIIIPYVTTLFTGNLFVFLSLGIAVKFIVLLTLETGLFCNTGEVKTC